jgi:ATP-dependent protease ClpP protease subunit
MRLPILLAILLGSCGLLVHKCNAEEIILTKVNHTQLTGEVNYNSTSKVIKDIQSSDITKPFYLYIYSPGGNIVTSFPLMNILKQNPQVICISEMAISMAFSITQSCVTRDIVSTSILMQHQGGGSIDGEASKIKTSATILEKLMIVMNTLDATRLGLTLKEFASNIHDEWWLIGSDDIIKNKAADNVITVKCDSELNKSGECPIGKLEP